MVELSDSNRRLIIFISIVVGGSVLLLFDIPVLYLMMAVIGLAVFLMLITGMLILSELIQNLRIWLKNRQPRAKKPKPTKDKGSLTGSGGVSIFSGLKEKMPKMPSLPSLNLSLSRSSEKPAAKREKSEASRKKDPAADALSGNDESGDLPGGGPAPASAGDELEPDLLDGLDLDDALDIDAELESVNPEFDAVRTPYGDTDVMEELPSEEQVRKMDIATSDEEEEIVLDTEDTSDEIDEIYSSTIDIGSDSGGDIISTMEGGDTISGSDLASYSSSDDAPYMYDGGGGDDDDGGGGEEQFELTQGQGMGDDDLIASLKADISSLQQRDDDVLLRDLKDVHVTAEELAEELEDIMNIIMKRATKNK